MSELVTRFKVASRKEAEVLLRKVVKYHEEEEAMERTGGAGVNDIFKKHMGKLPIRVSKPDTQGATLNYYLVLNRKVSNELAYVNMKSDDLPKIAKILKTEITTNSAELCEAFEEWETAVLMDMANVPKKFKPKHDKLLERALEALYRRSKFPDMYVDVVPISNDPETYCLYYVDKEKLKGAYDKSKGETPTWDEWLGRVNRGSNCDEAANVVMSFIWSIFEPDNNNRAALWLHGHEGKDGKSSATSALMEFIGRVRSSSISQDGYSNQFFFSTMYEKIFTVFADCKKTRLLSEGKIHSVLGRDDVQIEFKGRDGFHGKMMTKLWVNSNDAPELTDVLHERSRVIYVKIAQPSQHVLLHGSSDYSQRLLDELPAFLYKCSLVFPKYCLANADILLPEALDKLRLQCISDSSVVINGAVDEIFEFGERLSATSGEIREAMGKWIRKFKQKNRDVDVSYFRRKLRNQILNKGCIEVQKVGPGREDIWRGVGVRDDAIPEIKRDIKTLDAMNGRLPGMPDNTPSV